MGVLCVQKNQLAPTGQLAIRALSEHWPWLLPTASLSDSAALSVHTIKGSPWGVLRPTLDNSPAELPAPITAATRLARAVGPAWVMWLPGR
jgi:hypothetical protein